MEILYIKTDAPIQSKAKFVLRFEKIDGFAIIIDESGFFNRPF
ncbi:hypothetical protein [Mucilaginibacter lacusdianchii]|nr:hypothetical protein [Mucilaginibacter sp. JXJ CY 39]